MKLLAIFICVVLVVIVRANPPHHLNEKIRHDGHSLVSVYIENEGQRSALEKLGFDVWSSDSNVVLGENHILIPLWTTPVLSVLNVTVRQVLLQDVQEIIDQQEKERLAYYSKEAAPEWFRQYHDYEEIVFETRRLAEAHKDLATYKPSIGTTIQGRDIISISLHGGSNPEAVPSIVFMGGQHAREWISPATVMYILDRLLTLYGTDDEVTTILNKVNLVIVPVSNPDGYDYAWTNNRLWRKNRRQISGNTYGVDLNRNWDTHWGGEGSSKAPNSDIYCGTAPFSEPESTAISNLILSLNNPIGAIDWHSYSQLILRPWGWTRSL